jgi:hypothetical protein
MMAAVPTLLRRRRRLLVLVALASVSGGGWAGLASATRDGTAGSATARRGATDGRLSVSLGVTGLAPPSAPRARTFLSLWPACGCGRRTVLEQFSLRDGRRLRALARLPTGLGIQLSAPHATPGGPVWLTLATGPKYRSGVAGGDPQPNTCGGSIVRYDPATLHAATVAAVPRDQLISDAIPAPGGRRAAIVAGGCATAYFDMHYVIDDLRSGRSWTLGADARRCHALSDPAWSHDGAQLVFAYGPSILSRRTHLSNGVCSVPRHGRVVVAPAGHPSRASSWTQTLPDPTCSYEDAAFDRAGIAAVEGCSKGAPVGSGGGNTNLGDAFLVQLNARRRVVARVALKRGWEAGGIATDPRTGTVLVSESQANNNGGPSYNWAWSFDGRRLRLISRYAGADASTVVAEPW